VILPVVEIALSHQRFIVVQHAFSDSFAASDTFPSPFGSTNRPLNPNTLRC
jgi:hypothetical protein